MTLRISTFNCENLFSRARVLNFDKNSDARQLLVDLARLDSILAQPVYSDSDKAAILDLIGKLKGYANVNELRNKLTGRAKVNGKWVQQVKVSGRADWVGGITPTRDPLPTEAQLNTAKVIDAVGADVQCIIEVEDRPALESFCDTTLLKGVFPYNLVLDGNDQRGIDVGLLSKLPLGRISTHVFDMNGAPRTKRLFSRDCLEVEVLLPTGTSLFLLVNHFKSQGYGSKASNDARRKAQADRVVAILGDHDLTKELVVVAGDFNDKPTGAPLAGLLGLSGLTDVLAKQLSDAKERWTYTDKSQIDYLLVSAPLAAAMATAGIERSGMYFKKPPPGVQHFDTVTSDTNDASDHAAVWAEFAI